MKSSLGAQVGGSLTLTCESTGVNHAFMFILPNGTEILHIDADGSIWVRGVKVIDDLEVYERLREWVFAAVPASRAVVDDGIAAALATERIWFKRLLEEWRADGNRDFAELVTAVERRGSPYAYGGYDATFDRELRHVRPDWFDAARPNEPTDCEPDCIAKTT